MKRFIIALAMLLIAGFICGFEVFTVKGNSERYSEELENISKLINEEKYEEATAHSAELLKGWKKTVKHLDKYLYHDYIDNITEEIATLPVYTKAKDKTAIESKIAQIKIQLASIKESELPYIHNIL